jgi:hypothetical protein
VTGTCVYSLLGHRVNSPGLETSTTLANPRITSLQDSGRPYYEWPPNLCAESVWWASKSGANT